MLKPVMYDRIAKVRKALAPINAAKADNDTPDLHASSVGWMDISGFVNPEIGNPSPAGEDINDVFLQDATKGGNLIQVFLDSNMERHRSRVAMKDIMVVANLDGKGQLRTRSLRKVLTDSPHRHFRGIGLSTSQGPLFPEGIDNDFVNYTERHVICSGDNIDVNFLINPYWSTQLVIVFTNRGPFAYIVRNKAVVAMYTIDGEAGTKTHCNLRLVRTNIGSNAMEDGISEEQEKELKETIKDAFVCVIGDRYSTKEATNTVGVLIMPLQQAPSFATGPPAPVYRGATRGGGGKGAAPTAKPFQLPVGSDGELQNGARVKATMKQMAVTPGKETGKETLPPAQERLVLKPGCVPLFTLYHFHSDDMTDEDIVNIGNQCAKKRGVYTNGLSGAYQDLKDSDPALMAAMGVKVDKESQLKHEAILGAMSMGKRFRPSDDTDPDASDDEAEEGSPPSPKKPKSEAGETPDAQALGCPEENPEEMLVDALAGVEIDDTPQVPQENVSRPDLGIGLAFNVSQDDQKVAPSFCHPLPGGGLEISYTGLKPDEEVCTCVQSNSVKPMELTATLNTVEKWLNGNGAKPGECPVSSDTALLSVDDDPDEARLRSLGDCNSFHTRHCTGDDGEGVDSWFFTDSKTMELVAKVSIWTAV